VSILLMARLSGLFALHESNLICINNE